MTFKTDLQILQQDFKAPVAQLVKPVSTFPRLDVIVPDSWKSIILAPLYDVHIGSQQHDAELFQRHMAWIAKTPNVLTFNGGDLFDNVTPLAGIKMTQNVYTPEQQLEIATHFLAPIQHKMMFMIPGNHEDRSSNAAGISSAKHLADNLQAPYFPDYCFATIKWRGNNFRLLAHHGSGAAATPGAQRNSARKDMPWAKFDIFWTGHLHHPMADVVYTIDHDQATGEPFERNTVVIISPSYLNFFGGYGAKKRYTPGTKGLTACELQPDGRIDVELHARGKRL